MQSDFAREVYELLYTRKSADQGVKLLAPTEAVFGDDTIVAELGDIFRDHQQAIRKLFVSQIVANMEVAANKAHPAEVLIYREVNNMLENILEEWTNAHIQREEQKRTTDTTSNEDLSITN